MRDGWAGGDGETNPVANNKIKKWGGTGGGGVRGGGLITFIHLVILSFFSTGGDLHIFSIYSPCGPGKPPFVFTSLENWCCDSYGTPHPQMVLDTVSRSHCWQMASIGLNNLLTAPLSFSPVSGVRPLTFPPSAASGSGVLYGIHISKRTLLQPALDMWDLSAKRHRVKVRGQCTAMTCSFF